MEKIPRPGALSPFSLKEARDEHSWKVMLDCPAEQSWRGLNSWHGRSPPGLCLSCLLSLSLKTSSMNLNKSQSRRPPPEDETAEAGGLCAWQVIETLMIGHTPWGSKCMLGSREYFSRNRNHRHLQTSYVTCSCLLDMFRPYHIYATSIW